MRLIRLMVIGAVLLGAFSLTACGGDSGPSAEEKREAVERREKKAEAEELAAAQAEAQVCRQNLGGFLESLEEIEGRLLVGLNYENYFTELGTVSVAYNRIPFGQLEAECLTQVGIPSESAFNAYTEAGNIWQECFEALTCEEDSTIDPEIQTKWSKASRLMTRAQQGLNSISSP